MKTNPLSFKAIEHFLAVLLVSFFAQVAISGAPLDLSSAAGRTSAVTAILMAVWRAFRGAPDQPQDQPQGTTTGA